MSSCACVWCRHAHPAHAHSTPSIPRPTHMRVQLTSPHQPTHSNPTPFHLSHYTDTRTPRHAKIPRNARPGIHTRAHTYLRTQPHALSTSTDERTHTFTDARTPLTHAHPPSHTTTDTRTPTRTYTHARNHPLTHPHARTHTHARTPLQLRPSLSITYPGLQEQTNEPGVLVHSCWQPPFRNAHSFLSADQQQGHGSP